MTYFWLRYIAQLNLNVTTKKRFPTTISKLSVKNKRQKTKQKLKIYTALIKS